MPVADRASIDQEDLRHMTDLQFTRMGVTILDRQDIRLQCMSCGIAWKPGVDSSGHLPFDYWVCPAKCNRD